MEPDADEFLTLAALFFWAAQATTAEQGLADDTEENSQIE